jgi:hypothetical protein
VSLALCSLPNMPVKSGVDVYAEGRSVRGGSDHGRDNKKAVKS